MAINVGTSMARKALTIKTYRTAIWTTGLAIQMDSLAIQRKMSHMLALLVRISVIKTQGIPGNLTNCEPGAYGCQLPLACPTGILGCKR